MNRIDQTPDAPSLGQLEGINPVFGTHVPVLRGLEPPPERVLEFGTGYFSTATFLEMPSVRRLTSIEIYPDWREKMVEEFGEDRRWTLLTEDDEIPEFSFFDLIFVDDGTNEAERIATIELVLSRRHPRVVIHDAEFIPFLEAIHRHATDYTVHKDLSPYTAVVEAT